VIQFHLKERELIEEFMKPIQNYGQKPHGGLWSSTFHETYGSDWIQWLMCEEFSKEENKEFKGYLLTPKKDVKLYTVNSFEDSRKLIQEYGYISPSFQEAAKRIEQANGKHALDLWQYIDYERMSLEYDGFHLTRDGFLDTYLGTQPYLDIFDGFDCECTIWFRWVFEKIEKTIVKPKRQPKWGRG